MHPIFIQLLTCPNDFKRKKGVLCRENVSLLSSKCFATYYYYDILHQNDDYRWPKNLTQFCSIKWTLWFGKICVLSTISSARLVHFAKGVITIKHTATTTKTHTTCITTEWARAMASRSTWGHYWSLKTLFLFWNLLEPYSEI